MPDQSLEFCHEEAEEYLQHTLAKLPQAGVTFRTRVVDGDVAGMIVDTAQVEQVDLIVMTTHGYSGFTRWMLGSVTERVLRSAPCPVLAIRHAGPLHKILITLDGSRLAEHAPAPGLEIARLLQGQVTFMQVDQVERMDALEMSLLEITGAGLRGPIAAEEENRQDRPQLRGKRKQ